MKKTIALLCIFFLSFHTLWSKTSFTILDGFIYPKNQVSKQSPYQGSVLALYFYIEQNFSVAPTARGYCKGVQKVLFQMDFDSTGIMVQAIIVERYNWYSIDSRARVVATDLMEVIVTAPEWLKHFKGTLYFPLRFVVDVNGRVKIDDFIFTRNTPRGARIGEI